MSPIFLLTSFFFFFFFFFFSAILTTNTHAFYAPAEAPNPNSPSKTTSAKFIQSSCQTTLYPELCISSLTRYANYIQQSPSRLARVAAKLTFAQIHSAALHVSSHIHTSEGVEASALKDCMNSLGSAADQTKRSISEIGKLEHEPVGPESAWCVSNVQTWMSAALTNEETCTDGFAKSTSLEDDEVKADVFRRVGRAKQYTSNTLAFVNSLANRG